MSLNTVSASPFSGLFCVPVALVKMYDLTKFRVKPLPANNLFAWFIDMEVILCRKGIWKHGATEDKG